MSAKVWYRTSRVKYEGTEPRFYNPDDFDWAKYVMSHWQEIRDELKVLFDDETSVLKPYFEDTIQYPPKNWKTESFYFWTKANRQLIGLFPKTNEIIKKVPGLVSASINLLEPGSVIHPHYGDTNAIYRCHLGLKIPKGLPECGFRVEDEVRPWEDGKFLIFLDAYTHEAFNNSDSKRFILLLDVLRPEFRKQKYSVSAHIYGSIVLYSALSRFPAFRERILHAPKFLFDSILRLSQAYAWAFLTLQRNIFSIRLN